MVSRIQGEGGWGWLSAAWLGALCVAAGSAFGQWTLVWSESVPAEA